MQDTRLPALLLFMGGCFLWGVMVGALTVGLVALVAGRFTGGSRRNFVAKFGEPTMVEVSQNKKITRHV